MDNSKGWAKKYSAKFIEAGLVNYKEYGTVLVTKEALDRMAQSIIGKPVINETHIDVTPDNFEDFADGYVTAVRFEQDGWYWCDFIVFDEATQKNCENKNYAVSCSYDVTQFDSAGGSHNNIPFNQEVINGEYTHLAIVNNPRYEGARIVVYNSKGGSNMQLKFWNKKKEKQEIALEKAIVLVNGKEVAIKDLIELHKKSKLENQTPEAFTPDDMIEIDGDQVAVKDLLALRNDSDEDDKKKKEEALKNAEEEEKKKKDEELKNAEEEKKKSDEEKKKADNANFEKLEKARNMKGDPQPIVFKTPQEKAAEGRELYGDKKAGK